MAPFYGWGLTDSRLEPLRGGSLLFTTKFPEIPGTHFIDLGGMKGWVNLQPPYLFFKIMEIFMFDTHRRLSAIIASYKVTQRPSTEGCPFSSENTRDVSVRSQ